MLRAAEVTQAAGYTSFMFDTRNTKANTSYQTVPYRRRSRDGGLVAGAVAAASAIGAARASPMTRRSIS